MYFLRNNTFINTNIVLCEFVEESLERKRLSIDLHFPNINIQKSAQAYE